jgi:hypothetical protein
MSRTILVRAGRVGYDDAAGMRGGKSPVSARDDYVFTSCNDFRSRNTAVSPVIGS